MLRVSQHRALLEPVWSGPAATAASPHHDPSRWAAPVKNSLPSLHLRRDLWPAPLVSLSRKSASSRDALPLLAFGTEPIGQGLGYRLSRQAEQTGIHFESGAI